MEVNLDYNEQVDVAIGRIKRMEFTEGERRWTLAREAVHGLGLSGAQFQMAWDQVVHERRMEALLSSLWTEFHSSDSAAWPEFFEMHALDAGQILGLPDPDTVPDE